MIQEFHHPDTIVELTIRKNNNSKMASIQVRRNLEDQTINLNESYDVQDENQAKALASKIANDFGLNKFYIVEPSVNTDASYPMTITEIFARQLIDKVFNKASSVELAKFANDFRKECAGSIDEVLDCILKSLSQKQMSQKQLEKLAEYSFDLPSRKLRKPLRFQIDTNRINARGGEQRMTQLENWENEELIEIHTSDVVMKELEKHPCGGLEKRSGKLFTMSFPDEDKARWEFKKIESILWPNGPQNKSQRNDVDIVFHAHKHSYILITNDGDSNTQKGILGCAADLKRELDITVVRDSEAVEMVRNAIKERNEYACRFSQETGISLPKGYLNIQF